MLVAYIRFYNHQTVEPNSDVSTEYIVVSQFVYVWK